jgi:hypothetical protein
MINMKAQLIRRDKSVDELGNTIELKMWQLTKPTEDKPHGYKYSLVYVVAGKRMIGYDNAEGKGDHRHYAERESPYRFRNLRQVAQDFYNDVERYKRGEKL